MQISMYLVVKQAGRSLAATSATGPSHPGRLFYVHDNASGSRFMVDIGAEISIVPPSHAECSCQPDSFRLQAVNGTDIATFGVRSLTLDLGLHHTFKWVFVIADVQQPILGADFLQHFELLVNM